MHVKLLKITILAVLVFYLSACSTTQNHRTKEEEKKIATAKINTQLAMAYLDQHNVSMAKSKLLLALEQAPTIPDPWYSMGFFLETTGDKEQAHYYYLRAVELAPNRGDVQNNYGTFLCRIGEYQKAIQHFQLAIKDMNYIDTVGAYENAGLCALKIPAPELAARYFNQAVLQDPDRPTAYLELAKLDYQKGNYEMAKNNLNHFSRLSPPTMESSKLSEQLHHKLS